MAVGIDVNGSTLRTYGKNGLQKNTSIVKYQACSLHKLHAELPIFQPSLRNIQWFQHHCAQLHLDQAKEVSPEHLMLLVDGVLGTVGLPSCSDAQNF